jgi:hypothetical protein
MHLQGLYPCHHAAADGNHRGYLPELGHGLLNRLLHLLINFGCGLGQKFLFSYPAMIKLSLLLL